MRRRSTLLIVVGLLAMLCGMQSAAVCAEDKLTGMIIGRSGEILHVSVPQPLKEGTVLEVKPISVEPAIAEARVISCTKERPFIALAKVEMGDAETVVPVGAKVYASANSVREHDAPKPMKQASSSKSDKFSIQTGTFHPTSTSLRDTVSDYWQSYRLNYSLIRVGKFDTLLSAEYNRASGSFVANGDTVKRTMQVVPVTLLGRIKTIRTGGVHMFLGAGAGVYQIQSSDRLNAQTTSESISKFGREFSVGLESRHGWVMELRYRDVPDTDIEGYSLGIGAKF